MTVSNCIFYLLQARFHKSFRLLSQSFIKAGVHRNVMPWREPSFFLGQILVRSSLFLRRWNLHDNSRQFWLCVGRFVFYISRKYLIFSGSISDGSGVDIFGQDFWVKSLPKVEFSWVIVPSGRTSWVKLSSNVNHSTRSWFRKKGLDWHGPSAKDVWSSLEALVSILHRNPWRLSSSWLISANSSVVLLGHSNGGQGTWYLASHFPDRVIAGRKCC